MYIWFRRICSMLLIITMLVNLLPLQTAALSSSEEESDETDSIFTEDASNSAYILAEDIEKRTEYSKQFVMSNGLRLAAVYDNAIHYQENGQWKEIDNTLQLAITRSGNAYVNTAGAWQVSFPQNMTEDNGVTITKDGHVFTFRMVGELLNPELQDAIVESEIIEIPTATEEASAVEMTENVSVDSAEEQNETVQETVVPQTEQQAAEPEGKNLMFVSAPDDNVAAEIVEIDMSALKADAEYPETVADKVNSRLSYEGIYEDTDLVFDLNSNLMKESIVLKTYRNDLKGYIYTLEVGDMIPILLESGEIELRSAEGETVIMYMPEPYLIDAAGTVCFDVQVSLEGENGKYILAYELPREWLSAEERQWPVVVDPAVYPYLNVNNIRDIAVFDKSDMGNGIWYIQCGTMTGRGLGRIYLKYNILPQLSSADVIVSATATLHTSDATVNTPRVVEVHKVEGTWYSESINWANKPDYVEQVEDYQVCSTPQTDYTWDITDIARGWYEGENTGMMFKLDDAAESNAEDYIEFYASDHATVYEPSVLILFRNNNGLESYWDYTTSSAGRAGVGYVNQYSGNLVWTRNDIGFGGNRMPVTISHVYNTNDSKENQFGMGSGWRTNFNQMVYHWNNNNAYGDYYVWEDSDGTDHYFYYESAGTYKDEDGLGLTLTTTGSGIEKYCIKDKNGNASYFDTYGRLSKQSNNQQAKSNITITYTTTSGKLISTITDGAGRVYSFTYVANLLRKITYKGKGTEEIACVNFEYDTTKLTSVTDQDGKISKYTYTTNNLLESAEDIDGYKICYDYTTSTAGQPNRIKAIEEYSGTIAGGVLNIEYAHNQTKFTDNNGNVQIVQFNNMGNTISIQDDQGRAQYAQYAINDPTKPDDAATTATRATGAAKGNQLLLASKLQNTVGNMINYGSFEKSASDWWRTHDAGTQAIVSGVAYHGTHSLKITSDVLGTIRGAGKGSFTVEPGKSITFSTYVKIDSGSFYITIGDSTGTLARSETMDSNSEWVRMEVSYTNNTSSTKTTSVRAYTSGTAYIDCVQVEKAVTASRYNLIENGDFRYLTHWSSTAGRTTLSDSATPQLSADVYQISGNPSSTRRISQTVNVSGASGDTFVLAGWAKADSVPTRDDREFAMIATFKKGSTTVNTSIVRFNYCADSTINWQYAASPIVAKGAFDSIVIELAYDYNANTVYFDGVQLYKEEFGNSYTYDEDGNIISVKDVQSQTTSYEYEDNDLTAQVLPSGARLEYEYDKWHNVVKATSDTGVVYNFAYDTYGNNTSVSIVSGSVELTSSAAYTSDGNRLASTIDASGKVTTYSYHENTNVLQWVQYPEDTTATRTEYTYDDMYRLAKAEADVSTGNTLKAEYGYTNDLLTSIKTGSTAYSFTYGAFALRSNIKIDSRTLVSYSYTSRNNFLASLDYGNGDSIDYTYDKQGRVTKETYEDGDTVTYKYDNSGALASVTDSATGITSTYYYDYTDRLLRYAEKGSSFSHIIGYEYDEINNLTALVETINGTEHRTTYGYDDDNRVTSVANGSASETYTYDAYSRVNTKVTKNGSTTVLTDTFTYRAPTTATTSGQIQKLQSVASGYNVTYTYTYDDNGNILSVSDGSKTTSYVYDSANQLTRENNQAAGKTWVWNYDNAGNIISRNEYVYTTDTLGAVQDSVSYTYDSTWGDLLTQYDGKKITSDTIGNILTYGKLKSYTWEHGRELTTLTQGTDFGITKQPEDFVGLIGDEITFSVSALGSGLTYQWQVSTNGGTSWGNSGAAGSTTAEIYDFDVTEARVGSLYRCKITNADGDVIYSQPGEIIAAPIVIDTQPEDCFGELGDPVAFSVEARGEGLSYQWELSYNNGSSWYDSTGAGCTTPTVYGFDIAESRLGRLYRCKITDNEGNVLYSEPGEIRLDALTILSQPEDYVGRVGDTVWFSIEARGTGLTYQWQVSTNGGTSWGNSTAGGYKTPNASLLLKENNPGYLYRCKVTDAEGNVVYSEPGEIILLTETWEYTYNADGLRTKRTNGSTTYNYIYNGSSLSQMTVGSNTLYFAYDASGTPMSVTYNGTNYYYATNVQGDVTAILNTSGTAVVQYTYDAWGKILTTTGSMASTLGAHNPLRYRGYVYDTETTLYYLQSRYYDPEMGRFICADSYTSTGQGIIGNNMFAYCGNNPVVHSDPKGYAYKGINSQINYNEYEHTYGGHRENAIGARPDYFNLWDFVTNEDEAVVLRAEHIAFYKGTFVVKVPSMGTSGLSIGFILLGSDASSPNIVRHEYGHTIQLSQLGLWDYLAWVGAPSLFYYYETKRGKYPWDQYYDRPWELLADSFGQVNRTYPTGAHNAATLYWFFASLCSVFT